MNLNLGEGDWPVPGFTGVDRKRGQEIFPLAYPDNSADVIRASHCLEHFSHRDTDKVLADWVRVLKPGGVLKVAVPDFKTICEWYQEGREKIPLMGFVVGGQVDENDYHKTIFDEGFLYNCLQHAGLTDIKRWESETDDNASWEVSLNLQGTKAEWPGNKAYNKYSQYGEDGILEAIFEKIGTTNKYCVDVGAADGLMFSNVRQFIEQGWDGLLIESDEERFAKLSQDSGGQFGKGRVRCFNYLVQPVGTHSLDNLLEKAGAPVEFDLLSIDVDGQEYYLWNSLLRYRPRVVVIEYDPDADSMFIPALGGDGQAGWNATTFVAAARGYTAVVRTQTNIICVRRDLLEAQVETPVEPEVIEAEIETKVEPNRIQPVKIVAVISVPRLGFNANWHSTIRAMLALNIHVEMVEGVFWGQCLTRGIEKVLAQDAELILTIDYDTVFDVEHVVKLCQLIGDHPEYDAIVPVQVKRECNQMLFKMNGSNDFTESLTQIAAGHFGLTIFDANAFNRMPKPWFHDQPARDGTWNDGRVDADMWFWEQFGRANLKVALANEVRIGHLELGITWADQEFRAVRQTVSDYRTNGQPKECGGGLKLESL